MWQFPSTFIINGGYEGVINAGDGKEYSSLSEAYAAYEKELEKEKYKDLLK